MAHRGSFLYSGPGDSLRLGAQPHVAGLASRALTAARAQVEGCPQTRRVSLHQGGSKEGAWVQSIAAAQHGSAEQPKPMPWPEPRAPLSSPPPGSLGP